MNLVITCEHASAAVPGPWRALFRGASDVLASHRGWDPGAAAIARALARRAHAPIRVGTCTRLLVDLNRSPHNPRRFSEFTRDLPAAERARLDAGYLQPHVDAVAAMVESAARRGPVLHVAVHSFTPALAPAREHVDVGLLYDPARAPEFRLALAWQVALVERGVRTRRNFPYRGHTDGLPTLLRRRFGARRYAAFELELSQAWIDPRAVRRQADVLWAALSAAVSRADSRRR